MKITDEFIDTCEKTFAISFILLNVVFFIIGSIYGPYNFFREGVPFFFSIFLTGFYIVSCMTIGLFVLHILDNFNK